MKEELSLPLRNEFAEKICKRNILYGIKGQTLLGLKAIYFGKLQ